MELMRGDEQGRIAEGTQPFLASTGKGFSVSELQVMVSAVFTRKQECAMILIARVERGSEKAGFGTRQVGRYSEGVDY